jgi:hypothetical protein
MLAAEIGVGHTTVQRVWKEHGPLSVNLLDHLRSESHAPAADGLGVGHLGAAHPAEAAVHQVGTHFAREQRRIGSTPNGCYAR